MAKPVAKKLTKQEQAELEKQAEEQARLDEIKRREEIDRYGIIQMKNGVLRVFTETAVKEAWNAANPQEYMTKHFEKQLGIMELAGKVPQKEFKMLVDYSLYNLVHVIKTLKLEFKEAAIVLSLLFEVYRMENPVFLSEFQAPEEGKEYEIPAKEPTEEEVAAQAAADKKKKTQGKPAGKPGVKGAAAAKEAEEEQKPETVKPAVVLPNWDIRNKTRESDLQFFQNHLKRVCEYYFEKNEPFLKEWQVRELFIYMRDTYLQHLPLIRAFIQREKRLEDYNVVVNVDLPGETESLDSAVQTGKKKTIEEEVLEAMKEKEEEIKKMSKAKEQEKETTETRKANDEFLGLDEATVAMIREKLAETEGTILNQLEERQRRLDEKYEELTAKGKKPAKKN